MVFVKKIDRLVFTAFIGPFFMTFFIALFVLIMQFLWKYIDDLIGKGLDVTIVFELLVYASASFVPMALPLAMLLSSIMLFGNLGENYELVALKSSGISLLRAMRSMIISSIFMSIAAFFFSNYMLPVSNLKFQTLLYDIRNQKPALNIKQGVFYSGIDGYVIRIGEKEADNRTIHNIMIYDHTSGKGNDNVIKSKDGEMYTTEKGRYLHLLLYNGVQYQQTEKKDKTGIFYDQTRTSFGQWEKIFDLSSFKMTRANENMFKDNYQMLNLAQLELEMDTLKQSIVDRKEMLEEYVLPHYYFLEHGFDTLAMKDRIENSFGYDELRADQKKRVMKRARSIARNVKNYTNVVARDLESKNYYVIKHDLEWHRKFTLSIACLVLFFVGAPMGAIIRKGGIGLPMVVSIVFFVFYYVISISTEKSAKQEVITAFWGMWLSTMILFPIGVFLTYKAMYDSQIFNVDTYLGPMKRFFKRFKQKK